MEKLFKLKWLAPLLLMAMIPCIALTSCGDDDDEPQSDDPRELIVGKWICYEDAYGDPWDEPLVYQFYSDGTGYEWFQEEPYSDRFEFEYTVTKTKLRITDEDGYTDSFEYEITANGKKLVIYGIDDNDMSELHFTKSK